jgi:hypothetical protein
MPWGAAIGAIGAIAGGVISADGAQSAADTQAQAAKDAAAAAAKERAPWLQAGGRALNTLETGLAPGGDFSKKFSIADATNGPAEQHALQQGTQAIQNSAAAKGGLLSSNTNQDLVEFGQSNAATFENQAFNQWMSQQTQQLAATQSLAQVGQTQANLTADTNANSILAAGGAKAGGQVAQGNIFGSVASGLGQSAMDGGFLNKLLTPSGGGAAGGYTTPNADGSYNNVTNSGMGVSPNLASGGTSAGDFSDERLKDDIIRVGSTHEGLPIYKYRMKGSGKTQMGVMAQDVERVNPGAVSTHSSGYKMVDYNKVS